jgi:hypothetical protein
VRVLLLSMREILNAEARSSKGEGEDMMIPTRSANRIIETVTARFEF